jgi:hypothetical protein
MLSMRMLAANEPSVNVVVCLPSLSGPPRIESSSGTLVGKTYETLLRDLENRSSPRIAFDQGVLEIMRPHLEHERANKALATIVESALQELHLEFENAGSTTFKKEGLQRGFEPDLCFYIANVERIRNKHRIDVGLTATDPLFRLSILVNRVTCSAGDLVFMSTYSFRSRDPRSFLAE